MTGRFRLGKISTGIRNNASTASNPTAITTTRTVNGRRRAARISHISVTSSGSLSYQVEKRLEVALREGLAQHGAPHGQARQIVFDFGLQEKTLRFGDLHNGCQPSFVSSSGLRLSQLRRLQFDRSVLADQYCAVVGGFGFFTLRSEVLQSALVFRFLRPLVGFFNLLLEVQRGKIQNGKCGSQANRPVASHEIQSISAGAKGAVSVGPAASSVE